MARMILVEGLNGTGKTSLVEGLTQHVLGRNWRVRLGHQTLCHNNPVGGLLRELQNGEATALEESSLWLASMAWDARHFCDPDPFTIHIQESSWLQALALEQNPSLRQLMEDASHSLPTFEAALLLLGNDRSPRQRQLREFLAQRCPTLVIETEQRTPQQTLAKALNFVRGLVKPTLRFPLRTIHPPPRRSLRSLAE